MDFRNCLQYSLPNELRLFLRPLSADMPVRIDMNRFSQYDSIYIDGYSPLDDFSLQSNQEIDIIIYNSSREMHTVWPRQQTPNTDLWSLDEIKLFSSSAEERVTIWINRIYTNVAL